MAQLVKCFSCKCVENLNSDRQCPYKNQLQQDRAVIPTLKMQRLGGFLRFTGQPVWLVRELQKVQKEAVFKNEAN